MTATITETDVDSAALDELDFDPGCEANWNPGEPRCAKTAKWVIYFMRGCCTDARPIIVCDSHKDDLMQSSNPACCKRCGRIVCTPFRKAVWKIEPLNTGGDRG